MDEEELEPIEWFGDDYEVVCGFCGVILDVTYNAEWESWMVQKCLDCYE